MALIRKAAVGGRPTGDAAPACPSPFIVGVPRSGTTLLRLMLDAHPDLAIPPETHFIPPAARACRDAPEPARRFVETLTADRRWAEFAVDADELAARVASIEPFHLGRALRAFYALYAARHGKRRWGDKTPPYLARMRLIQRWLPEARFVHLVRDGRDVALSILSLWWGPNSVDEAATWWTSRIEAARAQVAALPHYLEVRYEDLVLDPERTLREVCDFVDLPWCPDMLLYHRRSPERLAELSRDFASRGAGRIVPPDERLRIHALTAQPPRPNRVGRWRSELSPADRGAFEAIAAPLLRKLGYATGEIP